MRTYGEGFIIVDQSPTSVDIAAIKNTNTKIIMRLPEKNDCEAVGNAVGLDDNQIMSNLKGCRVKLTDLELIYVRQYGVTNDKATAADVEIKKIGTWSLVGERRPTGWID
jgi:DNA helicase HerA-like ATPase